MPKTIEAVIDEDGQVRLLEEVALTSARRALVTILESGAPGAVTGEAALLAERALEDWNRSEEDAAWSHLQSPAT